MRPITDRPISAARISCVKFADRWEFLPGSHLIFRQRGSGIGSREFGSCAGFSRHMRSAHKPRRFKTR